MYNLLQTNYSQRGKAPKLPRVYRMRRWPMLSLLLLALGILLLWPADAAAAPAMLNGARSAPLTIQPAPPLLPSAQVTVPTTITGTEDSAIGLGITVDPQLSQGGSQLNLIGSEAGFRDAGAGATPTNFTIPAGTTIVRLTGYGGNDNGGGAGSQEEYQGTTLVVNLENNTYAGHTFYIFNQGTASNDNYAFSGVPLGAASDSGTVTGDQDTALNSITVARSGNTLSIVETQSVMDQAYLVEYLTNNSSADFLGSVGTVLDPGVLTGTLTLPATASFAVISIQDGRGGLADTQEDKGIGRFVVDLDSGLVSGTIFAQTGRAGNLNAGYAFSGYDLSANVSILSSGATIVGDTTANGNTQPDWTITRSGNVLTLVRAATPGGIFSSLVSAQSYARVASSSSAAALGAASTVGIYDDDLLGATSAFTLTVPGTAQGGNLTIAMYNINDGNNDQENSGTAQIFVDLVNGTTSGSFLVMRSSIPDLVSWTDVPFGVRLIDSPNTTTNHAQDTDFTDELPGVLQFDLVTMPNGARRLRASATTVTPDAHFSRDYQLTLQVQWYGRKPINFTNLPAGASLSDTIYDETAAAWQADPVDAAAVAMTPPLHYSGNRIVLDVGYDGTTDPLQVNVTRVADAPLLVTTDQSGDEDTRFDISTVLIATLVDTDTSEVLTVIELSGIAVDHTVSDGVNSFTATALTDTVNIASWSLGALTYQGAQNANGLFPLGVRVVSTDDDGFSPTTDSAATTDTVTVTINPINDAPTITQPAADPAAITIPENTAAITDINTLDVEDSEGSGLAYSVGGPDGALFAIDANGLLTFLVAPDYENPNDAGGDNVYNVTVTVTDSGGLTDTVALIITVEDTLDTPDLALAIDEPSPDLVSGVTSSMPVTVSNVGGAAAGGPLTTTIDLPIGVSAPASFSNNGWSCTTSGATTTCVRATALAIGASTPFNVPVTPDDTTVGTTPGPFTVTVAPVTDEVVLANNGPLTLTPSVAVARAAQLTVVKLADKPTPFVGDTITFTVQITNSGPSGAVDVVITDVVQSGFSYVATSIAGGDTQNDSDPSGVGLLWGINSLPANSTTAVRFQATVAPRGVYSNAAAVDGPDLTVVDPPGPIGPEIIITVTNQAPTITQPAADPAALTQLENTSFITNVNSIDDSDGENDGLSYGLSGADAALLSISSSGLLTFLVAPDYENPSDAGGDNVYNVTVTVTDSGGLTDTVALVITVEDVLDTPDLTIAIDEPSPDLVSGVTSSMPVTVSNVGGAAAGGPLTTTIDLPVGVSAPASFSDGGWSCTTSGATTTCVRATALAIGASTRFNVPVTPDDTTVGTTPGPFTVTVAAVTDEVILANNGPLTLTPSVAVARDAQLTVVKLADKPTPFVGDTVTFTIQITNSGPSGAVDVVITDVVQSGFSYIAASISGGDSRDDSDPSGVGLLWGINSLPANSTTAVHFQATVAPRGVYSNAAAVDGPDLTVVDPPGPIGPEIIITVTNQAPTITQPTADPAALTQLENTSFITNVNSIDDSDGENDGLSYGLSGADAALLSISSSGLLTFLVAPDYENPSDAGGDNVYNVTVTVTDSGGLTDTVALIITVEDTLDTPDLALAIDEPMSDLVSGVESSMPVTVSNVGGAAAGGPLTTTIDLPIGVSAPASFSDGGWSCTTSGQSVSCSRASALAIGASTPFNVPVTPDDTTVGTTPGPFTVTVAAVTDEVVLANNGPLTLTPSVAVARAAQLTVVKLADKPTPFVGDTVTFTIQITNSGPSGAVDVVITDVVQSGFGYVATSIAGGDTQDDSDPSGVGLLWGINSLPANSTTAVQFQATVAPRGVYSNAAAVDGPDLTVVDPPGPIGPEIIITVTNQAPTITQPAADPAALTQLENTSFITNVNSIDDSDGENDGLSYGLSGADAALLSISSSGLLTFLVAPDYENPSDAGGDNVYNVTVTVTDSGGLTDTVALVITVEDTLDTPDLALAIDEPMPELVSGVESSIPVTVSNVGGAAAGGPLTTTIDLPVGVSAPASFSDGGWSCTTSGATTTCVRATALAIGASTPFNVPVTPDDTTVGTTPGPFTVTVAPVTDEVVLANNGPLTLTPSVAVARAAQLTVVKLADKPTPFVGDTVTFTIQITNSGPSGAVDVVITDVVQSGFSYIAASISGGDSRDDSDPSGVGLLWGINSLPANSTTAVHFQATVAPRGVYSNAAAVDGPDLTVVDPPGPIGPEIIITVTNQAPTITQPAADPAALTQLENTSFITNVNSIDDSDGENDGLSYGLSGADAALLSISSSGLLNFLVAPDYENPSDAGGDNIYNVTVTVTDSGGLTDTVALVITVEDSLDTPDLALAIDEPMPELISGVESSMPVTVSNVGGAAAGGPLTTTVELPGGVTAPASFSDGGWSCTTSGQSVSCSRASALAIGASTRFNVPVTPDDTTVGTTPGPFTVTVAAVTDEVVLANNGPLTLTPSVAVARAAQLTVVKSASDLEPLVGDTVTFTVQITNSGPSGAVDVVITDVVQSGFSYIAASISGGDTQDDSDPSGVGLLWGINSLPANSTTAVHFQATVAPRGVYSNAAAVDGPDLTVVDPPGPIGPEIIITVTNQAPTITQPAADPAALTQLENTSFITNVNSIDDSDGENDGLSYGLSGADAALLSISSSGLLNFLVAPDYENPSDAGGDNVYNVTVTVTDTGGLTDTVALVITVEDTLDTPDLTIAIDEPSPDLVAGVTSSMPVTVSNVGGAAAGGPLTTTIDLPVGVSAPASFSDGGWSCTTSGQSVSCSRASALAIGASTPFNVPVTPDDTTVGTTPGPFTVVVAPVTDEVVLANNGPLTLTPSVAVARDAQLTVVKSASDLEPLVGDTVTFTVQITNSGPSGAVDVVITDVVQSGFSYIAASISGGDTQDDSDPSGVGLLWGINSLPANSTTAVRFQATVAPRGVYSNAAAVNGPDLTVVDPPGPIGPEIIITVTNQAPTITQPAADPAALTQLENTSFITNVNSIDDSDGENDGLSYGLSGADAALLSISGSGLLNFLVAPDYENPSGAGGDNVYNVTVTVTDTGGLTDTVALIITVEDSLDTPDLALAIDEPMPEMVSGVESSMPVTVSNVGGAAAGGPLTTTIDLPVGVTAPASFSDGGWSCTTSGQSVSCSRASALAIGASTPFNVPVTPDDTTVGTTPGPFTVVVAAVTDEVVLANNGPLTLTPSVAVARDAQLTVVKLADKPTPFVGDTITFTIQITNSGPSGAVDVVITDVVQSGFGYVATSITGGDSRDDSDPSGTGLLWNINALAAGTTTAVRFQATVAPRGVYSNAAAVDGPDLTVVDPPGPIGPEIIITVTNQAPTITQPTADPAALTQLENTSFITNVNSIDDSDGENDGLSYGLSGVDAALLSISSSGLLNFLVAPDYENPSDAGGDNVYNVTVTVTDSGGLTDTVVLAITVEDTLDTPDLALAIDEPMPEMVSGVESSMPVTVSNVGGAAAGGPLTTTVELPGGVTAPASFSNNGWSCTTSGTTTTCVRATALAIGASTPFNVPVTPDDTTVGTTPGPFTVTVAPVTDEVVLANNGPLTVTPSVAVARAAQLTVVKLADKPTPFVGDTITFTIQITNSGPSGAVDVVITDVVQSGFGYVATSIAGGDSRDDSDPSGTGLLWNINALAAGTTTAVRFQATVAPRGVYSNAAAVDGPDLTVVDPPGPIGPEIIITVTNQAPTITQPAADPAALTQLENTSFITNVNSIDDSDGENDGLSYGLSGADAALLSISSSGLLNFLVAPDYENPSDAGGDNIYNVTVTVTDSGGLTDTVALVITVEDTLDTPDLTIAIDEPSPDLVAGVTSSMPVTVSNVGGAAAGGPLTTTVELPGGVTAPASFSNNGWSCTTSGTTTTCVRASALAIGASTPFNVPVTPDDTTVGTTPGPFTVTVAAVTDEVVLANNGPLTLTPSVAVARDAQLTVVKSASDLEPLVGDTVTFTVQITNSGPSGAVDVVITDVVQSGFSYIAASISGGDTQNDSDPSGVGLLWGINSLPANSTTAVQFQATVAPRGVYSNAAAVDGPDLTVVDPPGPIGPEIIITVTNQAPTITQPAADPAALTQLENTSFITNVNSIDDSDGENDGLSYGLSGADAALLSISSSGLLTFLVAPDYENPSDAGGDNVYNVTVTVTDTGGLTDTVALVITVEDVLDTPDLTIAIDEPSPDLVAGVTSSMPVTVSNVGGAAAGGPLTTTIDLPVGVSAPASFSDGGWSCTTSGQSVSCSRASALAIGASTPFNVPVTPDDTTVGTTPGPFTVTVAPVTDEVVLANNGPLTVTSSVAVARAAQLTVVKLADKPTPFVGDTVTFTIQITNSGPSGAVDVVITDVVQSGFGYIATSISGGDTQNDSDPSGVGLLWGINSLPANSTTAVRFQAMVAPRGVYSNAAAVDGPDLTVVDPPGPIGPEIIITVTNQAPTITQPAADPAALTQLENTSFITNVNSIDDSDGENDGLSYGLSGADAALLSISSSGLLNFLVTPDYENPSDAGGDNVYNVTVTVTDTGGLTDTVALVITVEDSLDTPDLALAIDEPMPELVSGVESSMPVTVSNLGGAAAGGPLTTTIDLPVGVTAPASFSDGGWSCTTSGQSVSCSRASALAIGASTPFNVPVTPDDTTVGTTPGPFTVVVAAVTDEVVLANNGPLTVTSSVAVARDAQLTVVKLADKPTPFVGDTITFTIQITNSGPSGAVDVVITDVVQSGFSYIAASISGGDSRDDSDPSGTGLLWNINALAAGTTTAVHFQATVAPRGVYSNAAAVDGPDLTVVDPPGPIGPEIIITVTNQAPTITQPAADPALLTQLENTSFITNVNSIDDSDGENDGLSYGLSGADAALLSISSSGLLTFLVTPDYENPSDAGGDNVYNVTVTVTDTGGLTDTVALVITVEDTLDTPDLALAIDEPSPDLVAGVTSSMPVTVSNVGGAAAGGPLTTTIDLPVGVSAPASFSNNGWSCTTSGTTTTCVRATGLAIGASTRFNVPVTPDDTTVGTTPGPFTVTVAAVTDEVVLANNGPLTLTPSVAVGRDAQLTVVKLADKPTPFVGDTVTFTIQITNSGPSGAVDVVITDVVQSGFSYIAASISGGDSRDDSDPSGTGLLWNINALAAGTTTAVRFQATVAPRGVYSNAAAVDGPDLTVVDPPGPIGPEIIITVTNQAPTITQPAADPAALTQLENTSFITNVNSIDDSDGENDGLSYGLSGADAALLSISSSGLLTFLVAPDYENPSDAGGDNVHNVTVTVTDTGGLTDTVALVITVEDTLDTPDLALAIDEPMPDLVSGVESSMPVTVSNVGGAAAGGPLTTTIDLPIGVSAPASFSDGGWSCTTSGQSVSCIRATGLAIGASTRFNVPVTPDDTTVGTTPGPFTVTVAPVTDEVVLANNGPLTLTPSVAVARAAQLSVVKSASDLEPLVGDTVTFTVQITNSGPSGAVDVVITDVVQSGFSYIAVSISGGDSRDDSDPIGVGLVWTINSLPVGGTTSVSFQVVVNAGGAYTNVAAVDGPGVTVVDPPGPTGPGVTILPRRVPDLRVSVGAPAPTLVAGVTSYIPVTVSNVGTAPTTEPLTVTVGLPAGVDGPVSYSENGWSCTTIGQTVRCLHPGPLNHGDSMLFSVPITPDDSTIGTIPGPIPVTVEPPPGDPNPTDNGPTPVPIGDPVARDAQLTVVKSVDEENPLIGETVTFTVQITNSGPSGAVDVVITDVVQSGFSYVAASMVGGDTQDDSDPSGVGLLWDINSLPVGGTMSVSFQAMVNAGGAYTNVAAVDGPGVTVVDPPGPTGPGITILPRTVPDLRVSVGAPAPTLVAGVTSYIPVTVSNVGTAPTTEPLTVTVGLPAGMDGPVSYSENGWSCTTIGQTVRCLHPGPLNHGDSMLFSVPITPDDSTIGTIPGPIPVTVEPPPGDPNPTNNGPTPVPIGDPVARDAQLTVVKSANDLEPLVGDTVTFTVQITNSGPSGAVDVVITDVVQSGFSYVAASMVGGDTQDDSDPSGVGLVWMINSLPVGGTTSVSFQAMVNAGGAYTNVAAVDGPGVTVVDPPGPTGPGITILPRRVPDLRVSVGAPAPTLVAGVTSYIPVTVSNVGTAPTTEPLTVTVGLPAGVNGPVSYSENGWNCTTTAQTVRCLHPGPLNHGDSMLFSVPITPDDSTIGTIPGPIPVTVEPPPGDPNPTDNGPTPVPIGDPVARDAQLTVVKSVDEENPLVGETIAFTVQITNSGPSGAVDVVITDVVQSGFSYVAASISGGNSRDDSDPSGVGLLWVINSLPVSGTTSVSFQAVVNAGGAYTNVAAVDGPGVTVVDPPGPTGPDVEVGVLNRAPIIMQPATNPFTITIPENTTFVIDVEAMDDRDAENGGLIYGISGSDAGWFTIDTVGILEFITPPDYEAPVDGTGGLPVAALSIANDNIYRVTVTVTDSEALTDSVEFYVIVSDVPDTPELSVAIGQPEPELVAPLSSSIPVTLTNYGEAPATGPLTVTLTLPVGVTAPATFDGGNGWRCTTDGQRVSCINSGPLDAGAASDFRVPVTPDHSTIDTTPGPFTVEVDTVPGEVDLADNGPVAMTPLLPVQRIALMTVAKSSDNPSARVGDGITFTIQVTNIGPSDAVGVVITDVLQSGFTYVPGSMTGGDSRDESDPAGKGLRWTIDNLPLNGTVTVSLQVTITDTGFYTNVADIGGPGVKLFDLSGPGDRRVVVDVDRIPTNSEEMPEPLPVHRHRLYMPLIHR